MALSPMSGSEHRVVKSAGKPNQIDGATSESLGAASAKKAEAVPVEAPKRAYEPHAGNPHGEEPSTWE